MKDHTKIFIRSSILAGIVLGLSSPVVYAVSSHFYLSSGLGGTLADAHHNRFQVTYYNNQLTDAYPLNHHNSSTAIVSLSGGYEFEHTGYHPALGIGLGIYTTPTGYSYNGQVIEKAAGDPSTTLYNYSYNVTQTRLMLETQLTWMLQSITPFIQVGIGPSWNQLNQYTETAINNDSYPPLPPFQSSTHLSVAYQVAIGAGYAFNVGTQWSDFKHERIALGYRYVNLGQASLGTRGAVYPYRFHAGQLTANDFTLIYTHLF